MKRRVLVAASVLSLALPSLLTDAAVGSLSFGGSVALAQPAPSDPVTEAARQKYQQGVKAFEAGKFEDARSAFLQAYALKRVPAVLLNLGQSEIKSAHYEDGGNHLQQFIRDHKGAKADEIAAAEAGIAEAKKRTGHMIIIVNAVGADLSVDGVSIGKSPLLDPYFVAPGKRTVYATYQGTSATTAVDVKKGIATSATLTLAVSTPAPTAPGPTAPGPTAPAPTYSAPTAAPPYTQPAPTYQPYPTSNVPYIPPAANDPLAPMPTSTGPDQGQVGREPLDKWFKRKPIAWVGVGVTGVGLLGGIIFSGLAAGASGNANNYATQIADRAKADGLTVPPCGQEDNPNDDVVIGSTNYRAACETLRSSLGAYRANVAVAATSWILFGLGAIGTVTYALVDWYPKKGGAAQGPRLTAFGPIVSPNEGGAVLMGEF